MSATMFIVPKIPPPHPTNAQKYATKMANLLKKLAPAERDRLDAKCRRGSERWITLAECLVRPAPIKRAHKPKPVHRTIPAAVRPLTNAEYGYPNLTPAPAYTANPPKVETSVPLVFLVRKSEWVADPSSMTDDEHFNLMLAFLPEWSYPQSYRTPMIEVEADYSPTWGTEMVELNSHVEEFTHDGFHFTTTP